MIWISHEWNSCGKIKRIWVSGNFLIEEFHDSYYQLFFNGKTTNDFATSLIILQNIAENNKDYLKWRFEQILFNNADKELKEIKEILNERL